MENKTQKAYSEIFKVLNKHKNDVVFDIDSLKRTSELHLFGIKLKEEYGLNINPKYINRFDWYEMNRYCHICTWSEGHKISWSDDRKQPEIDEVLVIYSFSSGAYIFGEDYPEELFQRFWDELKSYSPKYCDSHNNNMYFSIENAKDVFNNFDTILKKYHDLNKEDYKQRQIIKMKEQLAKLENA